MRENCLKLIITLSNPGNIFETMIKTYLIKDIVMYKIQQYPDQMDYGMIEIDSFVFVHPSSERKLFEINNYT